MRKTILMLFSILTYGRATLRSAKSMRARFCACLIGALVLSGSLMAQEIATPHSDHWSENMPRRQKKVTYEQMTEKMVKELQLDEKQQKKVAKLNKKYKTLIEGEQVERPQGQRPPMGERPSGRPSSRPSGGMGGPGGGGFGGGMPGGGMGGPGGGMQGGPRGGGKGMPGGGQPSESSYDYDKQQQKYDKAIGKILTEQQYEGYQKIKPQFASQRRVREFLLGGQQALGGGMPMPPGGMGGSGSRNQNITYSGATELKATATETGKTYQSIKTDENALLVSTKEAVTIAQPTINKTGSSNSGDNCSFYGVNAALLVKGGSTTTIKGGTITSDADGANGVFSYGGNGGRNGGQGDGTTVIIEDTKITTTGGGSGGIMTTGGGVMKAKNLTINTSGRSSAPIRTDRGGGVVTVDGGSYTSNGLGSPVIYSTADVTVSNATLTSNMSEGVCIEGKNSITLNNCQMTVSNTQRNGHAQFLDAIMIYQSFSGDADSGNSHFTMNGGSLTNKQGHLFHVTNTNAIISLNNVKLVNEDPATVLLSVCADGWQGASNKATINASHQQLEGTILVGSDSELTLNLTDGSTFNGSINGNITNAEGSSVSTETGTVNISLGDDCTWTLTADTYITSLKGDASCIKANGHRLFVNGKQIKVD
jgi:hypothetical protein